MTPLNCTGNNRGGIHWGKKVRRCPLKPVEGNGLMLSECRASVWHDEKLGK